MPGAYLAAILLASACMLALDARYKLALWHDVRRTLRAVGIPVALFIVWDIICIQLGIFYIGDTHILLGWNLGPEFPVEEVFFLTFLCYFALILYRMLERRWPRT